MSRSIGIVHRVKTTKAGKAHPTKVCILKGDQSVNYKLETEENELSWIKEKHQISKDKLDGLMPGDTIAMILGGSGDNLAFALSRQADEIGAKVMRIPPFILKEHRNGHLKGDDHILLAQLVKEHEDQFYLISPRDRDMILMRECLRHRIDAMKSRISCEQRVKQREIGKIFTSVDGKFPEGQIEDSFDQAKANNAILNNLIAEEKSLKKDLNESLERLEIYQKIFKPITGCGPAIASRIISSIIDIKRFNSKAKLKKFCGVHVTEEGKFPRRRVNQTCNWNPVARQALFLLGDQFNRRPDSFWGQKLREQKKKLRLKHPEVILTEKGKKRYNDGHIHKMAIWKTLSKFVEYVWISWWELERS